MRFSLICLWGLCASGLAMANPVDWHPQDTLKPDQWMLTATSTHFNGGLDFTQGRDRSPSLRGTKSGDYRGNALSLSWQFLPHWAARASSMERVLEDVSDQYLMRTWEASVWTHQPVQWLGSETAFARLSAWGNQSDSLQSSTSKTVGEVVLTQSKIIQPRDQTWALEGGMTWSPSPAWKYHADVGLGWTELKYQDFQANGMRNGCEYQLQIMGADVVGTRIDPCNVVGTASQFSTPLSAYGLDLQKELAWTARGPCQLFLQIQTIGAQGRAELTGCPDHIARVNAGAHHIRTHDLQLVFTAIAHAIGLKVLVFQFGPAQAHIGMVFPSGAGRPGHPPFQGPRLVTRLNDFGLGEHHLTHGLAGAGLQAVGLVAPSTQTRKCRFAAQPLHRLVCPHGCLPSAHQVLIGHILQHTLHAAGTCSPMGQKLPTQTQGIASVVTRLGAAQAGRAVATLGEVQATVEMGARGRQHPLIWFQGVLRVPVHRVGHRQPTGTQSPQTDQ